MSLITILQAAPTTAPTQLGTVMDLGNWITILVVGLSVAVQVAANRAAMTALEKQMDRLESHFDKLPCADHRERLARMEARHATENGINQRTGMQPSPQT